MADQDERAPRRPRDVKERIAEQKRLRARLSSDITAGRIVASTEKITGLRVPRAPGATEELPDNFGRSLDSSPEDDEVDLPLPEEQEPLAPAVRRRAAESSPMPRHTSTKNDKSKAWDPAKILRFIDGTLTLGDLEGVSKEEQYEIASTGHRYLLEGRLPEARTIFEGLVVLNPHDAYFHLALGSTLQRQDVLEDAVWHYTRSLEINPFSCHAYANRGEVRIILGDVVDGVKDLLKAIDLDPDAVHPSTRRARATVSIVVHQIEGQDAVEDAGHAEDGSHSDAAQLPPGRDPRPRAASDMTARGPQPRTASNVARDPVPGTASTLARAPAPRTASGTTAQEPRPRATTNTARDPRERPASNIAPDPRQRTASNIARDPAPRTASSTTAQEPKPRAITHTARDPRGRPASNIAPDPRQRTAANIARNPAPRTASGTTAQEPKPRAITNTARDPRERPASNVTLEPRQRVASNITPDPRQRVASNITPDPRQRTASNLRAPVRPPSASLNASLNRVQAREDASESPNSAPAAGSAPSEETPRNPGDPTSSLEQP